MESKNKLFEFDQCESILNITLTIVVFAQSSLMPLPLTDDLCGAKVHRGGQWIFSPNLPGGGGGGGGG